MLFKLHHINQNKKHWNLFLIIYNQIKLNLLKKILTKIVYYKFFVFNNIKLLCILMQFLP